MFDFVPEGQALAVRRGLIIFDSNKTFKIGQTTKIKVQLPPQSGKTLTLPIQVLEALEVQDSRPIYQALVLVDLQGFEYLPTPSIAGLSVQLLVRSPDLPGFRAMAVEFSPRSALIELDAPIAPGTPCTLSLDADASSTNSVNAPASVVFCLPSGSKFLTQFRFNPTNPTQTTEIQEVYHLLSHRANSSLESLLESAKRLPERDLLPARHTPVPNTVAAAPPDYLVLPIHSTLLGYYRNLENGSIVFRFQEPGHANVQEIEFPQCQLLWDEELARCQAIATLRPFLSSPKLDQMTNRLGPGEWRHYQFLSQDGVTLMEFISRPCRTFVP